MSTHEYLLNKYGTTLTFQQASEETGIYWQTLREMCLRGDIKAPRAGKKWVLTTKAIAEYLDGETQKEKEVIPLRPGRGHRKIV
ncbi:MAG: helix-turn-helix domain-containing protein [Clostridiaceae bacterium]|nr:helix-turn-helix domain-containing protein [Clostridiaceae bacterium]